MNEFKEKQYSAYEEFEDKFIDLVAEIEVSDLEPALGVLLLIEKSLDLAFYMATDKTGVNEELVREMLESVFAEKLAKYQATLTKGEESNA